jgi:hypothetical protein
MLGVRFQGHNQPTNNHLATWGLLPSMEHPLWSSLHAELQTGSGSGLAQAHLASKQGTSRELLAMAALNAPQCATWRQRTEMMDFARVALEHTSAAVDVCLEVRNLFRALVSSVQPREWAHEDCGGPVLGLVNCVVAGFRATGKLKPLARESAALLCNALVDPVVSRMQSAPAARAAGKHILDALFYELQACTLQSVLLHRARRTRGQEQQQQLLLHGEYESSSATTSPAEFWGRDTDDSETPSSEASGMGSELTIPPLASAAAGWVAATQSAELMAFLTPAGRLAWTHEKCRVLLDRRDCMLAAFRGLDTLLALVPVDLARRSDAFRHDLGETLASALQYVQATQSVEARDMFARLVRGIGPPSARLQLLEGLAFQTPPHSPARGYLVDLYRAQLVPQPASTAAAPAPADRAPLLDSRAQSFALKLLAEQDVDLEAATAALSLLRALRLRNARGAQTPDVVAHAVRRLLEAFKQEDTIDPGDVLNMRPPPQHASPGPLPGARRARAQGRRAGGPGPADAERGPGAAGHVKQQVVTIAAARRQPCPSAHTIPWSPSSCP